MTVPFIRKSTRRNSSWPGDSALHSKAEYICADLSIDPSLFPCSPAADHTFAGVPGVCSFSTIGVCNSPVRKSHLPDLVPGDIQDLELSITSEFEDQIARFLIMESFHYLPTR